MERVIAIKRYVELMLKKLTLEERDEQLGIMLLESWEEAKDWKKLPPDLISEFDDGELRQSPQSERYDDVLRIWIKDDVLGASNNFLLNELSKSGVSVDCIIGSPIELYSCPCCGRKSLEERAAYDVCGVCWWEDDGQDNEDAVIERGGPNYGISLAQARYNFLTKGIYDPSREDLIPLRVSEMKYDIGRVFKLVGEAKVAEPLANLEWGIRPNA